ncbi:MAG: hypothetical protein GY852_02970 [bacterium]|nr:hypothetical protein [bacterium]
MVATTEEIGNAILIESISWQRGTTGISSTGSYNDFNIYLGYTSLEMLSTEFADNFIPQSRTLVHHNDPQPISAEPDEWFTIELDSPFWYNGQDNLILEITWSTGTGNPSTYEFNTPMTPVCLKSADPQGESGFLSSMRCQFMLNGTQELENGTFASVKVLLGS